MIITGGAMETGIRTVHAGNNGRCRSDALAIEEPLEIRIGIPGHPHRAISITMRTPGDDLHLAAGFLFTEGILNHPAQVREIRHCGRPDPEKKFRNTVVVELADGVEVDLKRLQRNFYTTSSCGVCGKSSIEALHTGVQHLPQNAFRIMRETVHALPGTLRSRQALFDQTGGLHASAIFDANGNLVRVCEDVGRHNALDKVIGEAFLSGELPLSDRILLVSGRASFELVQKALMAGVQVLAAVGAPSSLAVELASEYGMTLIGFVRDGRFNIYCGGQRVGPDFNEQ